MERQKPAKSVAQLPISINLDRDFILHYNDLQLKYGADIARLNGFDIGQVSYTDFIKNFIDEGTISDKSIDASSNVFHKDVVTLQREMAKPHSKLLAFNKIFYEMKKRFGFKNAVKWLENEWVGKFYMHDADTSTLKSYCFAYTLKDLAERGLFFDDGSGRQPAQHLITFIDFVKEFVSYNSNKTSGAVGMPDLIPYMFYFWNKDVENNYYLLSPEYYAKQNIQRFIYAVNQSAVRDGTQSAFTNTSIFDRPYFEALFGGATFPDGTFMIDYEEKIMQFQKWFMEEMAETRKHKMFTFPVNTISLLRKDGKFVDEETAEWMIRHNIVWSDSNFFISNTVSSLSNCCRLKSDITQLYFNSIGGTALKVGSIKVSTINLARVALDSIGHGNTAEEREEAYVEILKHRVRLNLMALDCVRHIIKRNVEKGLLPNFSYGLIDFKHCYNTCGFIGCYETLKSFGYIKVDEFGNTFYTSEASRFGKRIFDTIHSSINAFKEEFDTDYMINLEQIPGESAADKLMRKDKAFYPDANIYDLPLYGNQFVPLGVKTTLQERIRIAAEFDNYCSGGSVLHVNIDSPFDSYEKARQMIEYIADSGVTYFAFNSKINTCEDGHAFYSPKCPKCGKPTSATFTRISGFYTSVNTWAEKRREEFTMRKWHNMNA